MRFRGFGWVFVLGVVGRFCLFRSYSICLVIVVFVRRFRS